MKPPLAELVRNYRKQSGLTQQQLAQIAGVGKTVVYDIEKGKLTVQLDTLQKILSVLNIQTEYKTPFPLPNEERK